MTGTTRTTATQPAHEGTHTLATDAGMLALWDPAHFADVVDYDTWDQQLCEPEDVERHIRAEALVPLDIESDGCWGVLVRVGTWQQPARLTDHESEYRLVTSEPYAYRSEGATCLSGIEAVHVEPWPDVVRVPLAEGRYRVVVHLIAWEDEPGSVGADGDPSDSALPDFVVLIDPAGPGEDGFRTKAVTFDR